MTKIGNFPVGLKIDTSTRVKRRALFTPKLDPKNKGKGRALKSQTKRKITNKNKPEFHMFGAY